MPFTLAHPAIILPLVKSKKISITSLVIGAMIPDFKFYLQLKENKLSEDQGLGMFWFDLILVLILSFLFHLLLKKQLIEHLPIRWSQKTQEYFNFNWKDYAFQNKLTVLASASLGIASHIIWDAFTHHNGFFVEWIPFLSSNIFLLGHGVKFFFTLQILFSLFGLGIIASYIDQNKYIIGFSKPTNSTLTYCVKFILIYFLLISARLLLLSHYNSFWSVVIAAIGCVFYAWVIISILYTNKKIQYVSSK